MSLASMLVQRDDAPGFNVDEEGVQQPETNWSYGLPPGSVTPQTPSTAQTPTPPTVQTRLFFFVEDEEGDESCESGSQELRGLACSKPLAARRSGGRGRSRLA